jgi:hypothetical protein
MKELYKERPSQSPWPRVMRVARVTDSAKRSQRTAGLCIELRKQSRLRRPTLSSQGEGNIMRDANGKSNMTPTESRTTGTVGNSPHGSQEILVTSTPSMGADRLEKARCHKSNMHVTRESDSPIVPEKPANKGSVLCLRSWWREGD